MVFFWLPLPSCLPFCENRIMKNRRLFLFLGLWTLALLVLNGEPAVAEESQPSPEPAVSVGVLVDQPCGVVPELETSFALEVAQRLNGIQPVPLYPTERTPAPNASPEAAPPSGTACGFDGKPVALGDFPVLWVHQGDEAEAEGPLYSEAWGKALREYAESASAAAPRVVLLTGGAARLLKTAGLAEVNAPMMTIMNDRYQVGLIPACDPSANSLWKGLTADRNVFWFTNAVYQAFQACQIKPSSSPLAVPTEITAAAFAAGGPSIPCWAVRHGNCVFFALAWNFSQLYDRAANEFRTNTEVFLANILKWKATPENFAALTVKPAPKTTFPTEPLRRMMADWQKKTGKEYPNRSTFEEKLKPFEAETLAESATPEAFEALKREILLANPDLNFERILFIQRKGGGLGLPQNYNSNCVLPKTGYGNTLCELNLRTGARRTLFTPPNDFWMGDLELHFDAEKVLFSMPSPQMADPRWRLWELALPKENAPKDAAQPEPVAVPTIEDEDVDDYDACYLPDGGIVFCSTACFTGVPCIDGSGHVCNLYRKAADGRISQLTVEQDHDWNPVLLPNGRVLYLRWEYSDLPHGFSRILMHANPDGTNQTEYYGSGSYYPNTMFYARPIPGSSRFAAIVSGHHEIPRVGDLVVFDPSKGRKEAEGAVQRIPGAGKPVSPVALDFPIAQTWPKFTQPFPISETTFLTACQHDAQSPWSIWLVDVYDNQLELARPEKDADGNVYSFQEPVPIRKTERPPVLPERTDLVRHDADVFIADVYYGQGLPNVPRGTVKALRVFTYEFAYQGMGAEPHSVGLDGPWDPKRVLGTVPVYEDGSASFRIPATTPVAFQALDAEGRAIQLMRSWTTAMPGESVSCTGCHEAQNSVPPAMPSPIASRRPPVEITPGFELPKTAPPAPAPAVPVRGFSFQKEIQPILESHCVRCHDEDSADPQKSWLSFRNGPPVPTFESASTYNKSSRFSPSYYHLRRYVRTPTKESQMPVLKPYEFHFESTILGQILGQGHFGVQLSSNERARLQTWVDLNAPYYGSWGESRNYAIAPQVRHQYERRLALRRLYANAANPDADDPADFPVPPQDGTPAVPEFPHHDVLTERTVPKEPAHAPVQAARTIELAPGVTLELATIPGKDWLLGRFEVTNEQFRAFDPAHDSGMEYADFIHFSPNETGWLLSRDRQPVVRISYAEAEAFCRWLSQKTGWSVSLPTAEEWRFAAMAQADSEKATVSDGFWFGDLNADYARYENLSDISNQKINPRSWKGRLDALPPWRIADGNVNDRCRVSAFVGSYRANPWGLFDVHGNVSEWTASATPSGARIALGGSWYLPSRFSGIRSERHFTAGQETFDVGFRVKVTPAP